MEEGVSKQTSDSDIIEDTLPDIETDSELSKEKDVQTSINLENLKTLSTECLINPNEIQKCLFLKNVATDSLHYTGKIIYTLCIVLVHSIVTQTGVLWFRKHELIQ
jgi:hypothetical protein